MNDAERVGVQVDCIRGYVDHYSPSCRADIHYLLARHDTQREQLDKMREALEGFMLIYLCHNKNVRIVGEAHGAQVYREWMQELAIELESLALTACKALGREWGYWHDEERNDG